MDHAFLSAYQAALSSANERAQLGSLTLFMARIGLDVTHSATSDTAVQQAREGFFKEAFTQTGGQTIDSKGDWLFLIFLQPHEALRAALILKTKLGAWAKPANINVTSQIGIHTAAPQDFRVAEQLSKEMFELDFAVCHRLMDLCGTGEIYLTRTAFEEARVTLDFATLKAFEHLLWANHGFFTFPGIAGKFELGHIQPDHLAQPVAPPESELVHPCTVENDDTVWGWRPAPATRIPRTRWILDSKLRDGWFGEVWAAKEEGTPRKRMIECCFKRNSVELLKEEGETLELIKRKLTENRNVLRIFDISLEKPPFFIIFEHFEGKDLKTWAADIGGVASVPFSSRLELIAQVAAGLQGVSDTKVVHKTLTPDHILVLGTGQTLKDIQVKITNLSIGHIGLPPPRPKPTPPPSEAPPDAATEGPPTTGSPESEAPTPSSPPDESEMYTAPEVIAGGKATVQSDIYSVGVLLCQFILGNLAEPLSVERIQEIIVGIKRDALLLCFSPNPAERPDNPGKITQELRNFIKEREIRSAETAEKARRRKIEAIASIVFAVIAITVLAILGPQYWSGRKAAETTVHKAPKDDAEKKKRVDPNLKQSRDAKPDYSATPGETDSGGPGWASDNPTRKPAKKTEVEKFGIATLKYLIFPLCVVIVIGTLIQQFGPSLLRWFAKQSPPPQSPDQEE